MTGHRAPVDKAFMEMALELAVQSRPSPNPQVGAVIVKDNTVIGRGHHEQPGHPHAEINALREAQQNVEGADLYVTLEPCCHQGRTGPCVDAIIQAKISRVVVGMIDPDPRMSGKGIRRLQQHGIETIVGIGEPKCQELLHGYSIHRKTGRPAITLKAAITLDGYIATRGGDSKWISSAASRKLAHKLRAHADAVLVGKQTVLKDDPQLTVRHCTGANPLRVVMDSNLNTPPETRLVHSAAETPVLIAYVDAPPERVQKLSKKSGIELLKCTQTADGKVNPTDLAQKLGNRGILSLLIEGGGHIHGAFAHQGLATDIALFIAPKILGEGRRWIHFKGAASIVDALKLSAVEIQSIEDDIYVKGRFR